MPMNSRLLRPLDTGFSPRKLAGLDAWWDANDSSTVVLNSGAVEQWNDKSGKSRNAVQTTPNNRPTTTTVNGRTALLFDGSNDNLVAYSSALSGATIFAVANCTSSGVFPSGRTILGSTTTNAPLFWIEDEQFKFVVWGQNTTGVTVADGTTNVLTGTNTGTVRNMWRNGANNASATQNQSVAGTLHIGAAQNGGGQHFNGWIGELIVYSRVLATSERVAVERWLGRRWGVTVS